MLQIYEKILAVTHIGYFCSCYPDVFLIELRHSGNRVGWADLCTKQTFPVSTTERRFSMTRDDLNTMFENQQFEDFIKVYSSIPDEDRFAGGEYMYGASLIFTGYVDSGIAYLNDFVSQVFEGCREIDGYPDEETTDAVIDAALELGRQGRNGYEILMSKEIADHYLEASYHAACVAFDGDDHTKCGLACAKFFDVLATCDIPPIESLSGTNPERYVAPGIVDFSCFRQMALFAVMCGEKKQDMPKMFRILSEIGTNSLDDGQLGTMFDVVLSDAAYSLKLRDDVQNGNFLLSGQREIRAFCLLRLLKINADTDAYFESKGFGTIDDVSNANESSRELSDMTVEIPDDPMLEQTSTTPESSGMTAPDEGGASSFSCAGTSVDAKKASVPAVFPSVYFLPGGDLGRVIGSDAGFIVLTPPAMRPKKSPGAFER